MMNTIIKKSSFFDSSEFNYMESYFEEYASRGYALKGYNMGLCTFEQEEGCTNRRYRVLPCGLYYKKKQIIQKHVDFGWKQIPTGIGNLIFYTDDPMVEDVYKNKNEFRKDFFRVGIIDLIIGLILAGMFVFIAMSGFISFEKVNDIPDGTLTISGIATNLMRHGTGQERP